MLNNRNKVLEFLFGLGILYEIYEHPPLPTVEDAMAYWQDIPSTHCKNLFFRNHKGNRHYMVILDHRAKLEIHDLEKRLNQGKLSFASEKRMEKYLGVRPGSVSLFGVINDEQDHVHIFLDQNLQNADKISFHPNDNTATVVLSHSDFMKFLESSGNGFEFIKLYD